jgi:ATP-dependent Clp protease adaptor protein ClpS
MTAQTYSSAQYTRLKAPNKYNVIMINDNITPMEFVIQLLVIVFNKSVDEANAITMTIHEQGRGIAGTYSYEVAEEKCTDTISTARASGYPLDVVIEEVE